MAAAIKITGFTIMCPRCKVTHTFHNIDSPLPLRIDCLCGFVLRSPHAP